MSRNFSGMVPGKETTVIGTFLLTIALYIEITGIMNKNTAL